MNYRATMERFSHIDAEFVRASADFTPNGSIVGQTRDLARRR